MTVQIEVSPEVAQMLEILRANARAVNVTLEVYLQRILQAVMLLQPHEQDETAMKEAVTPQKTTMLEALEATRELLKDMPVRGSTEESLKILRQGRAGRMWGYEPAE
ncbi:MAG: hypothetical protein M3X11_24720 [Acidobacteriota bacterium]|nr:hypothetical protein [Acidobacteriota bacterium]